MLERNAAVRGYQEVRGWKRVVGVIRDGRARMLEAQRTVETGSVLSE